MDSTVLIDYLRGRPAAARLDDHLDSGDVVATTAINVEEIVRGLRPEERPGALSLFDGLVTLPIGRREGWQAGEWRQDFVRRGLTLSQADCLIAATATIAGARLATGNPDDFPMPDLVVEHWPAG